MTAIVQLPEFRCADISIRGASIEEIDVLCDIDRDASVLFEQAGLYLELPADHEFCVAERTHWLRCLAAGTTLLALDTAGAPIGFMATGLLDAEPYVDQLSVRTTFMRQGVGTALLAATAERMRNAGWRALWLSTYRHLPWNRPFYERRGFAVVAPDTIGRELAARMAFERRWLPRPEERVAMRMPLTAER